MILWKQLTVTDFNDMNGKGARAASGGGARHVALGVDSTRFPIRRFLGLTPLQQRTSIRAQGLVAPNLAGSLTLSGNPTRRNGEWLISDQHAHRHPAWSRLAGFPSRYSKTNPPVLLMASNGRHFYAGFLLKSQQETLPPSLRAAIRSRPKGILPLSLPDLFELRSAAPTPVVAYYRALSIGRSLTAVGRRATKRKLAGGLKKVVAEIVRRQGQGKFRAALIAAYAGECAITSESLAPVLEAAHIVPFRLAKAHRVANGILLRADWHVLFDLGLVSVQPGRWTILVSRILDGSTYERKRGRKLRLPGNHSDWPSAKSLREHLKTFTP